MPWLNVVSQNTPEMVVWPLGLTPPPAAGKFEFEEATIEQLQAGMKSGQFTAHSLVEKYLRRIDEIDKRGPAINSVIEVNPDALAIAETLDRERKAGRSRGLLHGIPILIKDNIDTADRMMTTAGSLALVGGRLLVGAPRDDGDGDGADTGAVYLLDAATGAVRRRYPSPTGEHGAGFGMSVAGDRRVVLVGAPYAEMRESGAGAGYLLDARSGALLDVLSPQPNEADANAGRAVAVTASRLLVGGSDWSGIGIVGVWAR